MADQEEYHHQPHCTVGALDEVAEAETKDRGLFDFGEKKEEEIKKTEYNQEEAFVSDFEKIKVSEPKEQEVECKEKDKKHGSLLEKLNRSDSSSSSSSDEEKGVEGGEKKKKKKGLKEKIKEKIAGEEGEVKIEKCSDHDNAIPIEKCEAASAEVQPTDEKGFLEKMKEKLPGQTKKTEEEPLPTETYVVECVETEPKEKKGLLEKIKEKIPGYHSKTEEEKEKEKECTTH